MNVALNQPVPDIERPATGDKQLKFSDLRGQRIVLWFFPKASTSGCTQEGLDFSAAADQFAAANTVILGASRDGIKAQENFKAKQSFPFDLLSDKDETLCKAFDVIKLKKMYGKESLGIERSTFLIDETGQLIQEWRGVKVPGHVDTVLEAVRALD